MSKLEQGSAGGTGGEGESSTALTPEQGAKALEGLLFPTRKVKQAASESTDEESEPNDSDETEQKSEEEGGDAEESEETEEESEEADDESGEESDEEQEEEPSYEVVIDGKKEKVTLSEALKGYSREAHFTRKSQAHAEQVKKFEAEVAAPTRVALQSYTEKLKEIETTLKSLTAEEPKWDEIEDEMEPVEFLRLRERWATHKERLAKVAKEREEAEGKLFETAMQQHQKFLQEEAERLQEALPEWKDATKAKAERDKLVAYAKSMNFTEEDLASVADHRIVVMLRKAMLYDAASKAKPPVKQAPPKSIKPGAPNKGVRAKGAEIGRLKSRLAQTGRPEDAVAVLERLI